MSFSLFTPTTGLIGGSLIGLSAATLLLFNGDILGASGLLSTVGLNPQQALESRSVYWKLVHLSSFCLTAAFLFGPDAIKDDRRLDSSVPTASTIGYVVAGLLVGMGTKIGNGCTSGHGVCGLGRRSERSFVSVMTFMATAIGSTYAFSQPAFRSWTSWLQQPYLEASTERVSPGMGGLAVVLPVVLMTLAAPFFWKPKHTEKKVEDKVALTKLLPAAVSGALFASGLGISRMVVPSKLFDFLNVTAGQWWDPTLATVLGSAVVVSMLAYELVPGHGWLPFTTENAKLETPIHANEFSIPNSKVIDSNLVLGAVLFGAGWSIADLCPGPALFAAAVGHGGIVLCWMPAFFWGSRLGLWYKERGQQQPPRKAQP